jgi:hypothetical protein
MIARIANIYGTFGVAGVDQQDLGQVLGRDIYFLQQGFVTGDNAAAMGRWAGGIVGGNPSMVRWEAQRAGATFETIPHQYFWNGQWRTTGAGTCCGLPMTANDEQPVKLYPLNRLITNMDNLRLIVTGTNGVDYRGWLWYIKLR